MEFIKNLSSRSILLIIHQLSMLIIVIYLGNQLDLASFGFVSSALIFYQISYLFTEWGFSIDSLKKINTSNLNHKIISNILISKFLIFLVILLIFFTFELNLLFHSAFLLESLFLAIFISSFNNLWLFQAINKSELLIIPTLIGRLLGLIIIFLLVKDPLDIYIVFISQSIAFSFAILYGYFFLFNKLKFKFIFSIRDAIKYLRESSSIFIATLFQNNIHSLWVFAFSLTINHIQIGYLNLADNLIKAGSAFNTALTETMITNKFGRKSNKVLMSLIILLILFSVFGILFLENVIDLIFEGKFNDALPILKLTIISWLLMSINKIIGYPILGEHFSYKFVNNVTYFFALINILVLLIIVFFYKINLIVISAIFLLLTALNTIYLTFKNLTK